MEKSAKHEGLAPVKTVVTVSTEGNDVKVDVKEPANGKYLFVTPTCPNCKLAKEYLKDEDFVVVDATENVDLAKKYGIMTAPTLVVVNGDSSEKFVNASNIKKYVDEKATVNA